MADNSAPIAMIADPGNPVARGAPIALAGTSNTTAILANGNLALLASSGSSATLHIVRPDGTSTSTQIDAGGVFAANVTVLSDGRIAVLWSETGKAADTTGYGVRGQIFDATGVAAGVSFPVNSATVGGQYSPLVTKLVGGGFMVAWVDASQGAGGAAGDSSGTAVKAQVFNAAGARVGGEILVNTTTSGAQTLKDIVTLSNGNVAVVWDDASQVSSGLGGASNDVRGQILAPTGAAVGGEIRLNFNQVGSQTDVQITALANGGFAAIWDINLSGNDQNDVGLRVFDSAGAPVSGDIVANTSTKGYQYYGDIVTLANGDFVVTWLNWQAPKSISAQVFSASGTKIGSEIIVGNTGNGLVSPDIDALANGGFVISWSLDGVTSSRTYNAGGTATSDILTFASSTASGSYVVAAPDGSFYVGAVSNLQIYGAPAYQAYAQQGLDLKGKLSVADADSGGGIEIATLSVSFGTLHLEAGTSGATITGNDTGSVSISGTIAQINALFSDSTDGVVRYNVGSTTPPPSASLTLAINDNGNTGTGGPLGGSDTETIILKVDAAPVVTTSGGTTTFTEPSNVAPTAVKVDSLITVSDADHLTLASATVRIGAGFTSGQDVLALTGATGSNITASYDSATGTLTLTSAGAIATLSQWQAALRNVTYLNTSDAPSTATRRIDFLLNDGVVDSAIASRNLTVTPSNDSPKLDLNGPAAGDPPPAEYRLHSAPVALVPIATLIDPDSPNFSDGTLIVSYLLGSSATTMLSIINGGGITSAGNTISFNGTQIATYSGGDGPNGLFISFNAASTQAGAEALIHAIGYSNSGSPALGYGAGFRFTFSDGDGGVSAPADMSVTIVQKDDFSAPTQWTQQTPATGLSWYSGDFNGDGKDDLFRVVAGQSGAEMHLSNGTQFNGVGSWTGAGEGSDGIWNVGDFNGDGKADIFRYMAGISGAQMFLSNGAGFSQAGSWTGAGLGNSSHWNVGDFNGDGKDDIFRYIDGVGVDMFLSNGASFDRGGTWSPAGQGIDAKWYVGDFNGDGKDDVFRYLPGISGADMFLSNGAGFDHVGSWTGAGYGSNGSWYVGDVNGDGKDDIFRTIPGANADVFLSNGSSFVHDTNWTATDPGVAGWTLGDFDGDHSVDLARVLPGGTEVLL